MSWIAGLAGKAEELLNKVDKTAAFTLGKSGEANEGDSQTDHIGDRTGLDIARDNSGWIVPKPVAVTPSSRDDAFDGASRKAVEFSRPFGQGSPGQNARQKSMQDAQAHSRKVEDDLFRYLNSSPETNRKSNAHSRQSSTASNKTSDSGLHFTARPETPVLADMVSDAGASARAADVDAQQQETAAAASEERPTSSAAPSSDAAVQQAQQQQLSALRLENDLLRSEVSSLNQEISTILKREKRLEHDMAAARQQLLTADDRMSSSDQALRELRGRESDAHEALRAKDSQVAVLRVRLEECEGELAASRRRADDLESERSRVLKDHSDSSGVHGHAVDTLKVKVAEAESLLARERESHREAQKEMTSRLVRLEGEQQTLAETITQLQKRAADERTRADAASQQLRSARQSLEASRQELAEYKDKAARILQSKDRLLASMRDEADPVGAGLSASASSSVVAAEIEELRGERAALREEVQHCRATVESLRMELQDMDVQRHGDAEAARADALALESRLAVEQAKAKDAESALEAKARDCRVMQEELNAMRAAMQRQIQERDAEIEKLRNQLVSKRLSTASEAELEGRLHALTESLIQKQTLVESLSTERSSLRLQLERLEQQCRAMEAVAQAAGSGRGSGGISAAAFAGRRAPADGGGSSSVIGFDDDGGAAGVRARNLPAFMTESPSDTPVMRRLKRSANTLDRFSVQLGLFLRRYPLARIFVIAYMMLLHLWVMIVLMTYQPEMHSDGESSKVPKRR